MSKMKVKGTSESERGRLVFEGQTLELSYL